MTPASAHPDQDALMDLAYGELPQAEALEVQRHVDGCAECTGTLASIGGVRRAMAPLADVQASDAGLDSLLAYAAQTAARNAAAPVARPRWWQRFGFPGLATAASALCVLALVWTLEIRPRQRSSAESLAAGPVLSEGWEREERFAQRPDGKPDRDLALDQRPLDDAPSASPREPAADEVWPALAAAPPPPPPPPPAGPRKRASRSANESWPSAATSGGGASGSVQRRAGSALPSAEAELAEEAAAELEAPRSKSVAAAPKPTVPSAPTAMRGEGAGLGSLGGATRAASPSVALGREPLSREAEPATPAERKAMAKAVSPEADAAATPVDEGSSRSALLEEATSLRKALAQGATGQRRHELLTRLCHVEDALGEVSRADATCGSLLREFPQGAGAAFARQRQAARSAGGGASGSGE